MNARPSLVRSIPFWALLAGSVATAAAGAFTLVDKLGTMTTTLTDGSATGVDVYVGQSIAILGAVLLGAGVIGILLTLAVATAATLRPHPPVEVVEPIDGDDADEVDGPEHGYERGLGYTEAVTTVDATETIDANEESAPTR